MYGREEMNDCNIHVDASKQCIKQIPDTSIDRNQQVIIYAVVPLQLPGTEKTMNDPYYPLQQGVTFHSSKPAPYESHTT